MLLSMALILPPSSLLLRVPHESRMIQPSALLVARRRGYFGTSLAALGFCSCRLDARRRDVHAQLLPLLRPLRRNLQTASHAQRDARLGVALLEIGRASCRERV